MKSALIWLVWAGAVLLGSNSVTAWNRPLFNRYSRNLYHNGNDVGAATGVNNGIDYFNALFGIGNGITVKEENTGAGGGVRGGFNGGGEQQTEVYGIVEPLIEDMPCVDRPCNVNEDCCPTGVCVNTYGDGKCIYVYGRKRDVCHRNADCASGMACVKGAAGNLICEASALRRTGVNNVNGAQALAQKQRGENCVSSSDCNVGKGMCCQLQRNHHRVLPQKVCAFFRDPFMCIDIGPTEDEGIREQLRTSFAQRGM